MTNMTKALVLLVGLSTMTVVPTNNYDEVALAYNHSCELNNTLLEENSNLHIAICSLENKINNELSKEQNPFRTAFEQEVFTYMKSRLVCPEANFALALHESGNFNSPFYEQSYNMFCMGLNRRGFYSKKVWSNGDQNYKCGYSTWKHSIDDMAEWQQNHLKNFKLDPTSNVGYIKSLKCVGYAEDISHENSVLAVFNRVFNAEIHD